MRVPVRRRRSRLRALLNGQTYASTIPLRALPVAGDTPRTALELGPDGGIERALTMLEGVSDVAGTWVSCCVCGGFLRTKCTGCSALRDVAGPCASRVVLMLGCGCDARAHGVHARLGALSRVEVPTCEGGLCAQGDPGSSSWIQSSLQWEVAILRTWLPVMSPGAPFIEGEVFLTRRPESSLPR